MGDLIEFRAKKQEEDEPPLRPIPPEKLDLSMIVAFVVLFTFAAFVLAGAMSIFF